MDVVVIGAGLAGLSTAYGLHHAGARVTVAEQAPADRPQGSGLSLLGNGMTALAALGLAGHVAALTSGRSPNSGGQRRPDGTWLYRITSTQVGDIRVVHRAELHEALVGALPPGMVRFETSAAVVDAGAGRVRLRDAAGGDREFGADLVVCADGIRSPARAVMGLPGELRYAGYGAWRGVTAAPFADVEPAETWGRGLRFGVVPLPDGRVYWFAVRNGSREEDGDHGWTVQATFGGWHDPIRRLVEATPADTISWSPIDELARELPSYVAGRCVLVGDAAHAMTPNLGQGGNQGLEDAATLVRLLAGSTRGTDEAARPGAIEAALTRYDALRRPRSQRIARQSRLLGGVAQAHGPVVTRLRDLAIRGTPAGVTTRSMRRLTDWQPPG